MTETLRISPLTRVEGHLDIELTLEKPDSQYQVVNAKSSGTMFRGFETILKGRDPRDATQYTQRVCGVCPISHGLASTMALEQAFALQPTDNGRILRNLILGSNYLQSHVLHFYHLAAPDFIDTTGLLDMSPWKPRYVSSDMVTGATAAALVGHYVQALAIRRQAHQMGAIFGGKMPATASMVPGGCTSSISATNISDFRKLLDQIRTFIDTVYIPDVLAVAKLFPQYSTIGKGCGNLLSYGVFELGASAASGDDGGSDDDRSTTNNRLLKRGRLTGGRLLSVDPNQIKEYVKYSYYASTSGNRNPSVGETQPSVGKGGAYSWIKSPRYLDQVHEAGPLARMWVNGDYRTGISVIDRTAARALEAKKIGDAMSTWLGQLVVGRANYVYKAEPTTASGIGLTEAPRGALGHWVQIASKKISRYQIITPTAWNASPMDDRGHHGPIEQALIGLRVADKTKPVEVLRVVHSFDPCLSCSVHMVEPSRKAEKFVVHL